ncbi:LytR/AlgR family response regulator transcription factor [Taibaiella koreensis]|uniref:LytR/AlgR family response regulator transcription factor n=1 Tax=Taibaiella koreensis TaxID=1268548 RepID=UPI000E59D98E|nr:LytTR family DNA-binding domain-containing protein [Taibaiella koreensis]
MNTFTTIIIDDEPNAIGLLKLSLEELFPDITVKHTCTSWSDAFRILQQEHFDFIFMDIQMPGRTGIELARLLPDLYGKLIFITAHEEYALDAFRCHASGYLLKPVDDVALYNVISRAMRDLAQPAALPGSQPVNNSELLGIPDSKGINYIHKKDIVYLQADNKCTKIVLTDKVMYSSYHLGRFREYLEKERFFQVHRSYIINLSAVKRYVNEHTGIIMTDLTEIPVARSAREALLRQFTTLHKLPG